MSDKEKLIEYELQIEDMLRVLQDNLTELNNKQDLSGFEQGRQLAYIGMLDIIKTRHKMILEVLK